MNRLSWSATSASPSQGMRRVMLGNTMGECYDGFTGFSTAPSSFVTISHFHWSVTFYGPPRRT